MATPTQAQQGPSSDAARMRHAEVFRAVDTGQLIRVSCTCTIDRDHTHAEWLKAQADDASNARGTAIALQIEGKA